MGESEDGSVAVPWRSPTVRLVLVSTVLAPLGGPLIGSALTVAGDAFGIGDARARRLVGTYFVAGIVLSPLVRLLADRARGRPRFEGCEIITE